METPSSALTPLQLYKLMSGSIVPRPIGWISTLSVAGVPNLAPFSYFNAVSSDPPTLMFSSGMREARQPKDTIRNVLDTGEFVVNIVTFELAPAMNITAADAPPDASEFELAGVTPVPARAVGVPRVLESPIHFECRLVHTYDAGSNIVVFGRIEHIHVADELLIDGEKIDIVRLEPIGRLAGSGYARIRELFAMVRPSYADSVVQGDDP